MHGALSILRWGIECRVPILSIVHWAPCTEHHAPKEHRQHPSQAVPTQGREVPACSPSLPEWRRVINKEVNTQPGLLISF